MNRTKPLLQAKVSQRLLVSLAMRQAFHVLKLPQIELAEWIKTQIDMNPLLEYCPDEFVPQNKSRKKAIDPMDFIEKKPSWFEYLLKQVELHFRNEEEKKIAVEIIGNLDEKGFFSAEEMENLSKKYCSNKITQVKKIVQSFDPPGIAAANLREALLIKLQGINKENSLAYRLIENHYEDFLKNRLSRIQKKLNCTKKQLESAITDDLKPFQTDPKSLLQDDIPVYIYPEILLEKKNDHWEIEIVESLLPPFQINPVYPEKLYSPHVATDERIFIRRYLAAGKWLIRILEKRRQTLKKITLFLLKKNLAFFEELSQDISPMTMKEVANAIQMHESTIARAVAGKYLFCQKGMIALRSFFNRKVSSDSGEEVSTQKVKKLLQKMVQEEKNSQPLSDSDLAKKLKEVGISCARRTIGKYRKELNISSSIHRKRWK
ncbi:MAG: RNA polymerase factor sigma-54 [Chlamydiae bacterium]|nr:RNA polymerase factor sigma-54 [Chlamydiota bacterium]